MIPSDPVILETLVWVGLLAIAAHSQYQVFSIDPVYDPKKEERKPKRIRHE